MDVQGAENFEFKRKFDKFVDEYVAKTPGHGIVTREKASNIMGILKEDPVSLEDSQLKLYVEMEQFQLREFPKLKMSDVLCIPTSRKSHSRANQGMFRKYQRVALKDEFFCIINEIHTQDDSSKHLGYMSTVQEINRHHAYIPRVLIRNFIEMCPLCSQVPDNLDLSQSLGESNDNQFPQEPPRDVKPDLCLLPESPAQGHFAYGLQSPQYSPAPPPPATHWGNNSIPQETNYRADGDIVEADHFMAVGKVSIIDIQDLLNLTSQPKDYAYLVHFIDVWSKYSILWPLRLRDIDELAFGIEKNVFAYFGCPKRLIFDTNFDEAQQLENYLKKSSEELKVTIGHQEPLARSGPVHAKIMAKLKELRGESTEVKLSKVQYLSNTKLVTTHDHMSPFRAVTGNDPMTEAFSSRVKKECQ